jgi:hypothetical protein
LAAVLIDDQTPKMITTEDWPHGFYDYTPDNAGTKFATGVTSTGRGRDQAKSVPAVTRLVERLGGPPAFRDAAAPETIGLLNDHALSRNDRGVPGRTTRDRIVGGLAGQNCGRASIAGLNLSRRNRDHRTCRACIGGLGHGNCAWRTHRLLVIGRHQRGQHDQHDRGGRK